MGERTASALVQHATREMPTFSKRIKSEADLEKLVSRVPKKPLVFLFTEKSSTPTLYKAISSEWHDSFQFYTIKDDPQFDSLKDAFGIKKTPTLLLWKGQESVEIYSGPLKIGHISHWLKQASSVKSTPKAEL
ncbi:hypothetical protein EMMF5_000844 [Cystobasidiomycetes sp. EMM_F5]